MNQRETITEPELRRLNFNEHWTQQELAEYLGVGATTIERGISESGALMSRSRLGPKPIWILKFAKNDSIRLVKWIYYAPNLPGLKRKHAQA